MGFFKNRIRAFQFAFAGLNSALRGETHLKIHLNAAVIVIILGLNFKVNLNEWFVLMTAITLVISFELLNSAIELLCNMVMPEKHHKIKYIKDVSAAAVLITVLFSVVAGCIIFIPKFLS